MAVPTLRSRARNGDPAGLKRINKQLLRYLTVDELIPRRNGVILAASIEALAELARTKRGVVMNGDANGDVFQSDPVETLFEVISEVVAVT